ncbi:hypothetical protein CS8_091150 [Cupriavidus sp. 8B]
MIAESAYSLKPLAVEGAQNDSGTTAGAKLPSERELDGHWRRGSCWIMGTLLLRKSTGQLASHQL